MKAEIDSSLAYLRSAEARASLAKDPYWPKWHSPWWHVLALYEAGAEVPREAADALLRRTAAHYLTFFPRAPEVLPEGKSYRTDVMCFCALGTLLCATRGTIAWADDFIVRYQLPDGGWNCDEESFVSSFWSTVPVLEYALGRPPLRPVVDRGMRFLLERKLFRSKRTGAVIDETWLTPSMPRFYTYDVLRGLRLVARWVERTGAPVPRAEIADAMALDFTRSRSWPADVLGGREQQGAESTFPLCEALGRPENAGPLLAAEWQYVRSILG